MALSLDDDDHSTKAYAALDALDNVPETVEIRSATTDKTWTLDTAVIPRESVWRQMLQDEELEFIQFPDVVPTRAGPLKVLPLHEQKVIDTLLLMKGEEMPIAGMNGNKNMGIRRLDPFTGKVVLRELGHAYSAYYLTKEQADLMADLTPSQRIDMFLISVYLSLNALGDISMGMLIPKDHVPDKEALKEEAMRRLPDDSGRKVDKDEPARPAAASSSSSSQA